MQFDAEARRADRQTSGLPRLPWRIDSVTVTAGERGCCALRTTGGADTRPPARGAALPQTDNLGERRPPTIGSSECGSTPLGAADVTLSGAALPVAEQSSHGTEVAAVGVYVRLLRECE